MRRVWRRTWFGKSLCVALLAAPSFGLAQSATAGTTIRSVDFRNFKYPWGPQAEHRTAGFHWLESLPSLVDLKDGVHHFDNRDCRGACPSLSLHELTYEYATGPDQEDAVVTLVYESGGLAFWDFTYIYTIAQDKPKLLAVFETGSRLSEGLSRVFVGGGHLVVELNVGRESAGMCCATWRKRTEYVWQDGHFLQASSPVIEPIPAYERDWYYVKPGQR